MILPIKKYGTSYFIDIPHAADKLTGQTVDVRVIRDDGEFKNERATVKRTAVGSARISLPCFKSLIRKKNKLADVTIADPSNVFVMINPGCDEIWVAAEVV